MFKDGLTKLQSKFDKRFYTTTLDFAHDLCEVIHVGINAQSGSEFADQSRIEPIDVSPTKQSSYSEARDRKRLGKRIIKSVQPQLEAALKAEAEITSKSYITLQKELEGMIDASIEIRKPGASHHPTESAGQATEDVAMTDAPDEGLITVAGAQLDGMADGEGDDKMDVDELSIEVKDEDVGEASGEVAADGTAAEGAPQESEGEIPHGVKSAPTPPDMNGYTHISHNSQPAPLTPPQSNGSLGRGTDNTLTEGGISWYLKAFEPEGTTAIEEQWAGRDAVRSLSEELTDMDEAELNDLEFNVEDSTITASSVDVLPEQPGGAGSRSGSSSRRKAGGAAGGASRKRLRSSARRR